MAEPRASEVPGTREEVLELIAAAASSWRLGMEAQASALLVRLVDALVAGTAGALPARAEPVLAALVAAQLRGDAIGLADGLEHELLPLFEPAPSGRERGASREERRP